MTSWFDDLRLRWKLLGAFGTVLLAMSAGAGFGIARLVQATDSYNYLIATMYATRSELKDANTLFITRHKILKDIYLFDTDAQKVQSTIDQVAGYDKQFTETLASLRTNPALQPEELNDVETAIRTFADYQAASYAAIAAARQDGDAYTRQQTAAALTSGRDKPVSAALDDLGKRIAQRTADGAVQTQGSVRALLPIVVGFLTLAALLGLAVAFFLASRLVSTVGLVARAADGLAQGDLEQRVDVRSKDELGARAHAFQEMAAVANAMARGDLTQSVTAKSQSDVLGQAFVGMIANLRGLVAQIQPSAANLAETSAQLDTAANHSGAAVLQVNQAIQTLAGGAQEAGLNAQETPPSASWRKLSTASPAGRLTRPLIYRRLRRPRRRWPRAWNRWPPTHTGLRQPLSRPGLPPSSAPPQSRKRWPAWPRSRPSW